MTNIQFCPNCGTQRVQDSPFCAGCGNALAKRSRQLPFQFFLAAAFLLVVMVSVGLAMEFNIPLPEKRANQASSAADQAHAAVEQHNHEDPPFLAELRAKAATNDPEALVTLAESMIQFSGQDAHYLADAAEPLNRLLADYPDHAYALRMLGNVYYQLEQPARSIAMYERYLAIHPEDANVRTDMATQLLLMERYEEAIESYSEALRIFPNLYTAYFNMSIAYQRMDREDDAEQARAKAQAIAEQHGKQAAPIVRVPRLPDGVTPTAPAEPRTSDFGVFGALAKFFTEHQIVGPKMTDFKVSGTDATLFVRNFPMEAMPPFVRQTFDEKIKQHLADAGDGTRLEIRDSDNQSVLATYPGD